MSMKDSDKDDMDSLFEGMVLFSASQITDNDDDGNVHVRSDPIPSVKVEEKEERISISSSTSQPLDENLFSDLTVITPSPDESRVENNQSTSTTSTTVSKESPAAVSMLRQPSRRKKRVGLRIGYGRDSQQLHDQPLVSSSSYSFQEDTKSFSTSTDLEPRGDKEDSGHTSSTDSTSVDSQSKQVESDLPVSEAESNKSWEKGGKSPHRDPNEESSNLTHENNLSEGAGVKETTKDNDVVLENIKSREAPVEKYQKEDLDEKQEDIGSDGAFEHKYNIIKKHISEKLRGARELATSISVARKEFRRRRRKASLDVDLAAKRYRELEQQLEEACKAEDFEAADRLSGMLAAADEEKERLISVLREADADCDSVDSKMQEALNCQIASEEECTSLLQQFSMDAVSNADLVLQSAEVNSSRKMDKWFTAAESFEVKKLELEVKSQVVKEAQSVVNTSIDQLVENDKMDKAHLLDKKTLLMEELEKLLSLVRAKEAEIAENDSKIEEVDKRINEAVSGFEEMQSGILSKLQKLQTDLNEMESESEVLSEKKKEIDDFLELEKYRSSSMRNLADVSEDEASKYQENLELRKSLLLLVIKSKDEKIRLDRTEEKILVEIQQLRQEVSVARASLQELFSRKSNIQQEIASFKQRVFFIDKRLPELEAEKKAAASARNFKEAARVAAESKTLSSERETQQAKVEEFTLELEKAEQEISDLTTKMGEMELLVVSKEREVALAQIQRLHLVAASATAEREAALELGDEEEACVLLGEAEAAESAAKQLQILHDISEGEVQGLHQKFVSVELACALDGRQLAQLAGLLSGCPS